VSLRRIRARDPIARARIRALSQRVAALESKIDHPLPSPPPQPNTPETVDRILTVPADWTALLIEDYVGASITAVPDDELRFWIPGPQDGTRCETQAYHGTENTYCSYEWGFRIPSHVTLSTEDTDVHNNTICQTHADKNAGYTGGVVIRPNGQVAGRVRGGHELSMSGSHQYEYQSEDELGPEGIVFGEFERDVTHNIRIETYWHRTSGWSRFRLDDGDYVGVEGVPTWPIGDLDGVESTKIMFRLGWYPQTGWVESPTGLEMFTTPLKFGFLDV
jgi:hypothetical protein